MPSAQSISRAYNESRILSVATVRSAAESRPRSQALRALRRSPNRSPDYSCHTHESPTAGQNRGTSSFTVVQYLCQIEQLLFEIRNLRVFGVQVAHNVSDRNFIFFDHLVESKFTSPPLREQTSTKKIHTGEKARAESQFYVFGERITYGKLHLLGICQVCAFYSDHCPDYLAGVVHEHEASPSDPVSRAKNALQHSETANCQSWAPYFLSSLVVLVSLQEFVSFEVP